MRIAIVTTSWPAGETDPAGHFVRAHARDLAQSGSEVVVVRPRTGGAFGWPGAAARIKESPIRAFDALGWVVRARRDLAALRVDRIIAHWAVPSAWPIGMASQAELEIVSHGGDIRLLLGLPAILRGPLVRQLTDRAIMWTFVSEELRASFLAALDADTRERVERIAIVRAALIELPDSIDAVVQAKRELIGRPFVICVGRLIPSKRVDRALDYAERRGHALVVVGDGPERLRLETMARERNIDARFVGLVGRDEALAWIRAADALVHASRAEGLSTVIREATAMGTKVVRLTS